MRVAELREIVFRSVDEAAAVAKAEGIALDVTEAREVLMKLVDTSRRTGNSKSSMREDIIRRRTEIDTIVAPCSVWPANMAWPPHHRHHVALVRAAVHLPAAVLIDARRRAVTINKFMSAEAAAR